MKTIGYFMLFLITTTSFAQKVKVIDKETDKPIPNVTVFSEKELFSSSTNKNGVVDLSQAKEQDVIIFSHISYALATKRKKSLKNDNYVVYLSKQSEQLDEVILSVFKEKARSNKIAERVEVITAKEIEQLSPQTTAEILATIPGIKVQKSQMGGGSPVIRGMESNRVLLVVDGVRMNNAIYRKGHLQNSITVSPDQLERTEVVFGPSSVIYGSDALGGVIHYYTKTPNLSSETKVKTRFFNRFSSVNNEITSNASVEINSKKWGSLTTISFSDFGDLKMGKRRTHGFNNWGKVFHYSENTDTYFSETPSINSDPNLQRNSGYSQTDFLQKFFIPLNDKTDLKLNFQFSTSSNIPRFDRLDEMGEGNLKFAEWYYGPQQRLLISPQLAINPKKTWLDKGTFTLAYQQIKESRIQRKFSSLDRSYRNENVNIFSINGDFSIPIQQNKNKSLNYGFEFSHNEVASTAYGKTLDVSGNEIVGFSEDFLVQSRYPDGGSTYDSYAAYIGYRYDLNSKSTLSTGVRFTQTNLNAEWIDLSVIPLTHPKIKLDNSALTATIGYVFNPTKTWQLNTVLSSGFRSPNIDDIGRIREKAGDITVPNIYLKPEYAYSSEIGVQKYLNKKKFKIGFNTYYTLLKNYIIRDDFYMDGHELSYDDDMANIVANQNRGNAYIFGYTFNYQGKLTDKINSSGFITYTKGKTYDTNEPLSSIPPLFGQFDINYTDKKLQLGTSVRFNSKKDISTFNLSEGIDNHDLTPVVNENASNDLDMYFGSPSWISFGLNSSYIFNKNWKLQTIVSNIFDEHYREFASGISAPGRNFSFSLITTF